MAILIDSVKTSKETTSSGSLNNEQELMIILELDVEEQDKNK